VPAPNAKLVTHEKLTDREDRPMNARSGRLTVGQQGAASTQEGAHLWLLLPVLFCALIIPLSVFAQGAGFACRCCGSSGCPCDTPQNCPAQHPKPAPCAAQQAAFDAAFQAFQQDFNKVENLYRQYVIANDNLGEAKRGANGPDVATWRAVENHIKSELQSLEQKMEPENKDFDAAAAALTACIEASE
jgi:hypothetical protein